MEKFKQGGKSAKSRAKLPKKLTLTPEIQALYFQCLTGKLHNLTQDDQRLIIQVFNQQFPALKREAQRIAATRTHAFWQTLVNWLLYFVLIVLGILAVLTALTLFGCTPYIQAAVAAEVDPTLIQAAKEQANRVMDEAWTNGTEGHIQPVQKVVGADGTVVLAQHAPKRLVTLPDGRVDLDDSGTTITVIQQPPPLPTPIPPAPQDTRIQTTINGIDQIETKAILPEHLVVDQLDAVKKIADNGTLIAQQRFALAQYQINQEAELEYLRIVKSFVLWGFLLSIPFLLTSYWILKHVFAGYRAIKQDHLAYKLKELESAENIVYDKVPTNGGKSSDNI